MPTTWIEREALLRRAERGHQPAHAVEAEAHAEQLERRAGSARRPPASSAVAAAARVTAPPARRRSRSSLSRSACDDRRRRLRHEALVGSLPSARAISPSQLARGARALRAGRLGVDAPRRRAARPRRRGSRPSPRRSPPLGGPSSRRASRATSARRLVVAVGRQRAPGRAPGRDAALVAPARARAGTAAISVADLAPRPPASRRAASACGVARRGQQPLGAGHVGPDLLGHERDHRVRERQRLAQDVQERAPTSVLVELAALDQLEVPVAQLAVDEVVEPERGLGEVERRRCAAACRPSTRCSRERIQRSSTARGRGSAPRVRLARSAARSATR